MWKFFVVYCLLRFSYYAPIIKENQVFVHYPNITEGFLIQDTIKLQFKYRKAACLYFEKLKEIEKQTNSETLKSIHLGVTCVKLDSLWINK
jgi:hypothetical protein